MTVNEYHVIMKDVQKEAGCPTILEGPLIRPPVGLSKSGLNSEVVLIVKWS